MKYNYDEEGVAFYYFLLTIVGLYVIPATIVLLFPSVFRRKKEGIGFNCICKPCIEKAECQREEEKKQVLIKGWGIKHLALSIGWAIIGLLLYATWNAKISHQAWDPFEVLGISKDSAEAQVKKAFRQLSRKHHPDKSNEPKEIAEAKFIEINKAYKALTDEAARKNWEEYGNPDGPRGFSTGIALPKWLVESRFSFLVLVMYILAFGGGVPYLVVRLWRRSQLLTKNKILHATMAVFYHDLKEASSFKRIFELLCQSSEFSTADVECVQLTRILREEAEKVSGEPYEVPKRIVTPQAIKAYALLYAHFYRINIPFNYHEQQKQAVATASKLILGVLQITFAREWLQASLNAVLLSQFLVSAMWDGQNPLLQLPFVDRELAKSKLKKKSIRSIHDFVNLNNEDRRSALRSLDDIQYDCAISVAESFPIIEVESVSASVLGQEKVTCGGLITLQMRLNARKCGDKTIPEHSKMPIEQSTEKDNVVETFEFDEDGNLLEAPVKQSSLSNLDGLDPTAFVHCPYYPFNKKPSWWVIVANQHNTVMICLPSKVQDFSGGAKKVTFQFVGPNKPGPVTLNIHVKSDSVIGTDLMQEFTFTVFPKSTADSKTEKWDISGEEENNAILGQSEDSDSE